MHPGPGGELGDRTESGIPFHGPRPKEPLNVPVTSDSVTLVICTVARVAAHELVGLHDSSRLP
jgi:hypothetical protein